MLNTHLKYIRNKRGAYGRVHRPQSGAQVEVRPLVQDLVKENSKYTYIRIYS